MIVGHRLGGQLAACRLALAPHDATRLWLVASSAPFPRAYPGMIGLTLPWAFRLAPLLARLFGYWPGRRLGFGGREARSIMADWAATGRHDGYWIHSLQRHLDPLLAHVHVPIDAVGFTLDGFAPELAIHALADKLGGLLQLDMLDTAALGTRADHFHWLHAPDVVAERLVALSHLT